MKMNVTDTVKQACGLWPRILPALGVTVIKNRHQACPVCGGSDRFRFDDKEGRGTWFCNQCGAGDGLKLVEKVFGVTPSEAAGKVNAVTGNLPPVSPAVTAAAEAGTEADRKAAASLAVKIMEKARPATGNAYLTRKGFPGRECLTLTTMHKTGGVTYRTGDMVVPLYDDSGALVNVQLINADGLKRTLKGGQVKGTCHILDGKKEAGKRLWIAEGYATALTVHHLTGETVMVALSSVNLLSLASLARHKYPACRIVIAADRDLNGDGQTKASAAAESCEGVVALPPVFGDWNDAYTQHGGDTTRKAMYDAIRPPAVQYLWQINPVVQWLDDKIQSAFGRHQAPVMRLPHLFEPDEDHFILSGLFPNRKSHPMVNPWLVVSFNHETLSGSLPFAEFLKRHPQLRSKLTNSGGKDRNHQRQQVLLEAAIAHARDVFVHDRNAFEEHINQQLSEHLQKLDVLRGRQLSQLELDFADNKQQLSVKKSRKEQRQREIEHNFDSYIQWIEDTMTTEKEPYIQVIAVITGAEG
ncbi:primase-helicase zinc-binding domain-containing protein [Citrobacter freundii]|uniref:primase-helicase zinc-binding domain-containing protein n=1 Tax=Citrobacter freundii TaxID=546 RepID=UPI001E42C442|nr:primase-helicase zinc-binding domain-containing protein [Citrobacter freundii]MEA8863270.1 primase-helicase zinc-binding domain-containing protein [Citrobacter freundii]